jgi:hypothetical protein
MAPLIEPITSAAASCAPLDELDPPVDLNVAAVALMQTIVSNPWLY